MKKPYLPRKLIQVQSFIRVNTLHRRGAADAEVPQSKDSILSGTFASSCLCGEASIDKLSTNSPKSIWNSNIGLTLRDGFSLFERNLLN